VCQDSKAKQSVEIERLSLTGDIKILLPKRRFGRSYQPGWAITANSIAYSVAILSLTSRLSRRGVASMQHPCSIQGPVRLRLITIAVALHQINLVAE
jgi:hypothetical protein